ncbi:glutamine synthetase family protein [Roseovarius rhodophyticola]|uniref:Glutamine synthetase family protein n=1 Tax=Roseovarius rhodophyticola TaxID=3080827 RepID=A0ABZ2TD54_9RHOB|nr:glutamine synthetase family protein [Roseovarius sp. W115]MDV2931327.1 glutamine synthetase family protein [Roseovarius sp. W115]
MDLSEYQTFRVAASDLNGRMRGKRVPGSYADKLDQGAVRMPFSASNVDIFGFDIEDSPLVFETGDADGVLLPTKRGPVPLPWLEVDQPLVPMAMHHEDGTPFEGDPRHALATVLARYGARGWHVIAATELEFTLVDDGGDALAPIKDPDSGRALELPDVLSLAQLDVFDAFLSDLYKACEKMGIPVQTATCESGLGQFEFTLTHQDAMRAADDTWLFKRLIKRMARKHGHAATFMAKPFADDAGNGMHMHFSVLDAQGRNVFDNGGPEGSEALLHGLAGCLEAMRDSTLLFAPHANSYDRLVPGAHAPTSICWAYDNRTAALRVPGGSPKARRIEHRVAGGDTNPFLTFAGVLGAAMNGIEDATLPPAPITGNSYDQDLPQLAEDWDMAIALFEGSDAMARIFHADLIRNLVLTKRQEMRLMSERPVADHWKIYLETV